MIEVDQMNTLCFDTIDKMTIHLNATFKFLKVRFIKSLNDASRI